MPTTPEEPSAARLARAVARLTPAQRQILRLSAQEGIAYEEIGERLGISAGAVERHLARALVMLDRHLEDPPEP